MKQIVTVSSVLLILISCASPPVSGPDLTPEPTRKSVSNIPDWYLNTPSESGYRFETGSATSQDLQLAVNKASLDAQTRLAATIESEMEGYTKRVQEETGLVVNIAVHSACNRQSTALEQLRVSRLGFGTISTHTFHLTSRPRAYWTGLHPHPGQCVLHCVGLVRIHQEHAQSSRARFRPS